EPSKVSRRLESDGVTPNGLVVVDDLAGTGRSISVSLAGLLSEVGNLLPSRRIPLFVIVLFATEDAESKIRLELQRFPEIDTHLEIREILGKEVRAFQDDGPGFWANQELHDRAKALCTRLGTGLYKDPL